MTGTVTVSIEIELAWGSHDKAGGEYNALSEDRRAETAALRTILDWSEELDIPITFAVVGHLMQSRCSGTHNGPHDPGWFDADPGSDVDVDPLFYAPDLVEMILDSPTDHEFATHTYSHVLCDEVSDGVLDWELQHAFDRHEELGAEPPVSLVPPRHREPPEDAIERSNVRVVRKPYPGYSRPKSRVGRFRHALTRTHPVGAPERAGGILETHCTTHPSLTTETLPSGQRAAHPAFRSIPLRVRKWIHTAYLTRAIDKAADSSSAVHMWTHLYNLSNPVQLDCIREGLEHLARRRDEGSVDIREMQSLVEAQTDE